jgi:site-specific recombinase XerD
MDKITDKFNAYLKTLSLSNKTLVNYASDINHFKSWLISKVKALGASAETFTECIPFINKNSVSDYKQDLISQNTPEKTINRRLSTLRKLDKFLFDNQITDFRFSENVGNILKHAPEAGSNLIKQFEKSLSEANISKNTIKNYLSDVKQYISLSKISPQEISLTTSNDIKQYLDRNFINTPQATFNRKLSSLKKFFNFLIERNLIKTNPVAGFIKEQVYLQPKKEARIELTTKSLERKVAGVKPSYRELQRRIIARFAGKPKLQKALYNVFYTRPEWYIRYHSLSISRYIHFAILIVFASGLGVGIWQQFFAKTLEPSAYPTSLVRPNRYLSFQGRLTNQYNTPIVTSTTVRFELYDSAGTGSPPTGGNQLWDSGSCSVTPDQDGIFNVLLGTTSGDQFTCSSATEITSDVFSENAEVWLNITTGGESMDPRIQIATVAYALNAETLQGYPIDATGSATVNTVVTMNSGGEIVLAEVGPKVKSISGTFAIEGQALTLQTPDTSNGSIDINPDGTGTLNLTFEGTAPGGSAGGFVNATNANLSSGSLYFGQVANANTGYKLIELESGSTPSDKFWVDAIGGAYIAGNLGIGVTAPTQELDVAGDIQIANGSELYSYGSATLGNRTYTADNYVTDAQTFTASIDALDQALVGVGGSNYWTLSGNNLYPDSTSYNVGVGTTASKTKLGIAGGVGIGTTDSYANAAIPSTYLAVQGRIGIGTSSPQYPLDINGGQARISNANPYLYFNDTDAGGTRPGIYFQNNTSAFFSGDDTLGNQNFVFTANFSDTRTNDAILRVMGSGTGTWGNHMDLSHNGNNATISTDVGDILLSPNANVGIGVTAATQKLHISGNMRLTGALYDVNNEAGSSGQILSSTATGTDWVDIGSIGVSGTGTQNYLSKWSSSSSITNSLLYDNGTAVGIGTTDPSYLLDIAGDIGIASGSDLYIGGIGLNDNTTSSSGASLIGLFDDSMTYISADTTLQNAIKELDTALIGVGTSANYWTLTGSNLYPTSTSYNVGIGTTSPAYKLNVKLADNAGADEFRVTDSDGVSVFNVDSNGNIVFGVDYSSTMNFNNTNITSVNTFQIADTGSSEGYCFPGGCTTQGMAVYTIAQGGYDAYVFNSPVGYPFVFNTANVGIGVTAPTQKLDVGGAIQIASGSELYSYGSATLGNRTYTADNYVTDAQTFTASIDALDQALVGVGGSNYWTLTGSNLYPDSTSYNVAIGTTNAGNAKLYVNGNVGIGVTAPQYFLHTPAIQIDNGSQNGYYMRSIGQLKIWSNYLETDGSYTNLILAAGPSGGMGNITFETVNSEKMRLTYTGNLGIGTASPNNRLSVIGSVGIGTTAWIATAPSNGAIIQGNVGIGFTSPTQKLDVDGAIQIAPGSELYSYGSATLGNRIYTADNYVTDAQTFTASIDALDQAIAGVGTSAGTNYWQRSGTTLTPLTAGDNIATTGLVGVGITSPTAQLQVGVGTSSNVGVLIKGASGQSSNLTEWRSSSNSLLGAISATGNWGIGLAPTTDNKVDIAQTWTDPSTNENTLRNQTVASYTTSNSNQIRAIGNYLYVGVGGTGLSVTGTQAAYHGSLYIDSTNSGTIANAYGNYFYTGLETGAAGSVANMNIFNAGVFAQGANTTAFTNWRGFNVDAITSATLNGATITNLIGFDVGAITAGSTNIAYRGQVASGANRYNLYMSGTADNYLAGNVGVGLTAPTQKLDVNGAIQIANGSELYSYGSATLGNRTYTADNYVTDAQTFTASIDALDQAIAGVGSSGITGVGTSNYIPVWSSATSQTNSNIYQASGGNIGIGTTNPVNKLDIEGGAVIGATYSGTRSAPANGLLVEGNVGIGTTNPQTKLEIYQGDLRFSRLAPTMEESFGKIQAYNSYGIINLAAYIDFVKDNPADGNFAAIAFNNGTYGGSTIESMRITSGKSSTSGGYVGIGTSAPGTRLSVVGGVGIGTTDSFANSAIAQSNLAVQGNIGIGTTSPQYKLDVNGDIRIANGSELYSYGSATLGNRTYTQDNYVTDAQTFTASIDALDQALIGVGGSNYWTLNGNELYPDSTSYNVGIGSTYAGTAKLYVNGNVGIGTTSPTRKLYVSGDSTILGLMEIRDGDTDTTPFAAYNFGLAAGYAASPVSGRLIFGDNTGWRFNFARGTSASPVDLMTIVDNGNVGIGTTAPVYKLDVNGDIRIANGSELYSYGSATLGNRTYTADNYVTDAQTFTASIDALDQALVGVGGSNYWTLNGNELYPDSTSYNVGIGATYAGTAKLYVNGNVGIGLTNPTSKLEINGNLEFTTTSTIFAVGSATDDLSIYAEDQLNLGTSSVTSVHIGRAADNVPVILNSGVSGETMRAYNGNVGIGVTAPAYRLDVAGDIQIANGSELYSYGSATLGNRQYTINNYVTDAQTFTASIDALDQALIGVGSSGITGTGTSNYIPVWSSATSQTDSNIYQASGGNIGIGTTIVGAYKFRVEGNSYINGSLSLNNDDLLSANTITISDPGPGEGLLFNITAATWRVDVSPLDRTNADGNLNLYGTANNIAFWRPTLWVYNASNYTTATPLSTGGLDFTTTGTGNISLNPGGNVGIGTSIPGYKLDVNGDIQIANGSELYSYGSATLGNRQYTYNNYVSDAETFTSSIDKLDAAVVGVGGSNYWTLNGNNLYPDSTSYNVGIGITSPVTKVTIKDTAPTLRVYSDDGQTSTLELFENPSLSGFGAYFQYEGVNNIINYGSVSNGAYYPVVSFQRDNRQVGIGTTVPTKGKLNVLGSVAIGSTAYTETSGAAPTNGLIVEGNVGIGTTNPARKLELGFTSSTVGLKLTRTDTTGNSLIEFANSAGSHLLMGYDVTISGLGVGTTNAGDYKLVVKNNGNVGIGTTLPLYSLQVGDGTDVNKSILIQGGGTTGRTASVLFKSTNVTTDSNTKGAIIWEDDGSSNARGSLHLAVDTVDDANNVGVGDAKLTINSVGNIGIGTTSPQYKLDVAGDIQIANGSELYSYGSATLGNRTYTADNYVTDAQTFTASIDALDQAIAGFGSSANYWTRSGDDLSPTTAGDDLMKNTSGDIGSSGSLWDNIYGTTFYGTTFQGNSAAVTFGNASYLTTINGSSLTVGPTSWTATPTISGVVTMTSGFDSNAASTIGGNLTLDAAGSDLIFANGESINNDSDGIIGIAGSLSVSYLGTGMVKATSGVLGIGSTATDYEVPLTFSNGLTRAANEIKLGGTLTADTDIPLAGFNLTFSGATGSVGIGTTSTPAYKLDVNGDIRITGTSELYSYGSATLGNRTYTADNYVTDAQTFTASIDALDQALIGIGGSNYWTLNGNELYPDSTSYNVGIGASYTGTAKLYVNGNVGIGTTSPQSPLDIVGVGTTQPIAIMYSEAGWSGIEFRTGPAGYDNTFIGINSGRYIGPGPYLHTALGSNALASQTGNYYNTAIGAYALEKSTTGGSNTVVGAEGLEELTTGYQNTAIGYYTGYNLTTGYQNVFIGEGSGNGIITGSRNVIIGHEAGSAYDLSYSLIINDGGGTPLIFGNFSTDRLGFGTTTPYNNLDVIGSVGIGSTSWINTGPSNGLIVEGYVGIGTTSPNSSLQIGQGSTGHGLGANDLYVTGKLEVDGAIFVDTGLYDTDGTLTLSFDSDEDTTLAGDLYITGNLGAGLVSPVNKLDVEGGAAIGATYSGTSVAPTNGLIVEGNVGIGVTNPYAMLHIRESDVAGDNYFGGGLIVEQPYNAYLQLYSAEDYEKSILFGDSAHDVNGAIKFDYADSESLSFWLDGNYEKMRITQGGYVGIGVTSPQYALDIDYLDSLQLHVSAAGYGSGGGIQVGRVGALQSAMDADGGYRRLLLASGLYWNYSTNEYTLTNAAYDLAAIEFDNGGGITFFTDTTDRTGQTGIGTTVFATLQRMEITSGGNVGIGLTMTPSTRLHVAKGDSGDTIFRLEADLENDDEADAPRMEFALDGGVLESAIGHGLGVSSNTNTLEILNSVSTGGILFGTGGTNGYSNATTAMFIDGSGNVGIGLSDPNGLLQVRTNDTTTYSHTSIPYYRRVFFQNRNSSNTDSQFSSLVLHASGNNGNNNAFGAINLIQSFYNQHASEFSFQLRNSGGYMREHMRIDSYGNVGIGITSGMAATSRLDVYGLVRVRTLTTGGTALYQNAGVLSSSSSDIRLKENILTITNPLDKVMSLRGVTFNWIAEPDSNRQLGMIAQEAMSVMPEMIYQNDDGYYGIRYSETTGLLVEAIKEQQGIINGIMTQIDTLKLTDTGDVQIAQNPSTGTYEAKDLSDNLITETATFAEAIIANIKAGAIVTEELVVKTGFNVADKIVAGAIETSSILVKGSAEITGTIIAGAIQTRNILVDGAANVAGTITAGAVETADITTESLIAFQATVDNLLISSGLVSPTIKTNMISPLADATDVNIEVGKKNEDGTITDGKLSIKNPDGTEVASIDSTGDATISGTLEAEEVKSKDVIAGKIYADEIVARNGMFADVYTNTIDGITREEIEELLKAAEADQKLLADTSDWNINTATESSELASLTTKELYVTTNAVVSSLSISNSLTIGTDMVIQSSINSEQLAVNSIDTLTAPLSIQSLALAPVEIMAGKVKINTNGDVEIAGNLYVAGKVESSGLNLNQKTLTNPEEITTDNSRLLTINDAGGTEVSSLTATGAAEFKQVSTDKLVIANSDATVATANSLGEIETNAQAGSARLTAGENEITIRNANVTNSTLIYITATSSTQNNVLYVTAKGDGFFKVGFNNPIYIDVEFNWWIIDVSN